MTGRPDISSLTPHLVCRDCAAAIEFYKEAFGAEEMFRLPGPDGKLMHASISINGNPVMLNDEFLDHGALSPASIGGTAVTLHLMVADVDKAFAQAMDAGARVVMPVADQFWGDRFGRGGRPLWPPLVDRHATQAAVARRDSRQREGDGDEAMSAAQKVSTCLWFDREAEDAARFYVSLLPWSRITTVSRYGKGGSHARGHRALMVVFELAAPNTWRSMAARCSHIRSGLDRRQVRHASRDRCTVVGADGRWRQGAAVLLAEGPLWPLLADRAGAVGRVDE